MVYERVTQLHIDLLDKEIAALRADDLEYVRRQYAVHKAELKPYGNPLADRMYEQLTELDALLQEPGKLSPAVRDAVVAAMKYFVKEQDHIPDGDYGCTGLVDDALVVQAAVNRVLGRAE